MVNQNWAKPTVHRRPQGVSLADSACFKLDAYDLTPADELMLWSHMLETAALCSRLARRRLTQTKTLGQLTSLTPPLSKKALWELGDREIVELIARLRKAAAEFAPEATDRAAE